VKGSLQETVEAVGALSAEDRAALAKERETAPARTASSA
jgi:hypothetical protein